MLKLQGKECQGSIRPTVTGEKLVFFLVSLLVVTIDQLSKIGIRATLAPGETLFVVGSFLRLTQVHNTGIIFGLLQGHPFLFTVIISVVAGVTLLFVLFFSHRFPFLGNKKGKLALGLVFGGAIGNLIDRLRFGYVTDFIDVGVWPVFNIADSALTIGVVLLAYCLLSLAKARAR